jgi:transposase
MATAPLDMGCGTDMALSRVGQVSGVAKPHHADLFANRRATRMEVLVHDGIGVWLCARRLRQGRFAWDAYALGTQAGPTCEQLQAVVLGPALPITATSLSRAMSLIASAKVRNKPRARSSRENYCAKQTQVRRSQTSKWL